MQMSALQIGREKYCSVAEFARILDVSTKSVYRWIDMGMPYGKAGKIRIIPLSKAKMWLSRKQVKIPLVFGDLEGE